MEVDGDAEDGQSQNRDVTLDEPNEPDNDPPLYRGRRERDGNESEPRVFASFRSDVSFEEIVGGLLVLKTSHHMNWTLFLALMRFVEALLVTDNKIFPRNHQQLKEFFQSIHGVEAWRVVYCVNCEGICDILTDITKRPKDLICPDCQRDVALDVKDGAASFIHLPLIPQLRKHVERGRLYEVVRDVKDEIEKIFRGERFKGVLDRGNIPVIIGSDAAPITVSSSKVVYPIVMSLGNIPNRLTHHFSILCALFAGKREHEPPAKLFYRLLFEELEEIESRKPIKWSDTERKVIEIVGLGGDAPEMRKLANQCTQGYRSCLYCLTYGCWDGTAVRFGLKLHENPQRERTAQHRYACAALVDAKNDTELNPNRQYRKRGILGFPLVHESASFDGTKSLIVDAMHVVLLGFMKDVTNDMCVGCSQDHHLQRSSAEGFTG
jgi:hypothetical protein